MPVEESATIMNLRFNTLSVLLLIHLLYAVVGCAALSNQDYTSFVTAMLKERNVNLDAIPHDLHAQTSPILQKLRGDKPLIAIQRSDFTKRGVPKAIAEMNPNFLVVTPKAVSLEYMFVPHTSTTIVMSDSFDGIEQELLSLQLSGRRMLTKRISPTLMLVLGISNDADKTAEENN